MKSIAYLECGQKTSNTQITSRLFFMWQFIWWWQKWQWIAWCEQCQQIRWQILRHFSTFFPSLANLLVFLLIFVDYLCRNRSANACKWFIYWKATMQWRPSYLFYFSAMLMLPKLQNTTVRLIYVVAEFQDGVECDIWRIECTRSVYSIHFDRCLCDGTKSVRMKTIQKWNPEQCLFVKFTDLFNLICTGT